MSTPVFGGVLIDTLDLPEPTPTKDSMFGPPKGTPRTKL